MSFDLPLTSKKDINKIVKSLNANKVTGPDGIPLKLFKLSANVVDKYLTSIALVRPIYKKKDKQNKENYRLVII